jgi:exodeoxyribonuclease-3
MNCINQNIMRIKLASWNINGIRSSLDKLLDYLSKYKPDIIWFQEVRATVDQVPILLDLKGMWYDVYWNSAKNKKWYSGTAIFTKQRPLSDVNDLWISEYDQEGRVITLEYDKFYFVTVYTPNVKGDLSRLSYRQDWDRLFLNYLKNLELKKPVIVCWDLNVAHKDIDIKNAKENIWNAGFTNEERAWFQNFLDNWFLDTFRFFYPNEIWKYSWWSNFAWCREKNIWWRIDYFLASKWLNSYLKNATIDSEIFWSDHCPVSLEIEI